MQQQQLDPPAGSRANTEDARGDDARFIEHEHVAGAEEFGDFAENAVLDPISV
jgi:hypothetical protein